ncbi:DUF3427 domain-containing protein [Salinispira pacifica]|uniref:Helicase n=1 Tax=Salinispira pacifica TaxID=1307761 RepID=V5WGJ1_9SPIO|nr:DUF3427 domain-containing protein [Salinispira pacifica]AHC14903.1 hypothetical protein L21SP2_1506 [Salinispira pacifica]
MATSPYFEHLLTKAIEERIHSHPDPALAAVERIDEDAFTSLAQQYARSLLRLAFSETGTLERSRELLSRLQNLIAEYIPDWQPDELIGSDSGKHELLRALFSPQDTSKNQVKERVHNEVPVLGFTLPGLFTGTNSALSLVDELKREIQSASEINLIISFIRWSGLKLLLPSLEQAVQRGAPVKVLTTVYLGATENRCIQEFSRIGAQLKISFNTFRGRLHAKSWIFQRDNNFNVNGSYDGNLGTAYVGSSNVSRDALQDGAEWNIKITQREVPGVYSELRESFSALWEDPEFEMYSESDNERVKEALAAAPYIKDSLRLSDLPADLRRQVLDYYKNRKNRSYSETVEESIGSLVRPFAFQEEILERIRSERKVHNRFRNLVVVPTGAGKTMIAAFDYKRICDEANSQPRLLFIAHREELLFQARRSFRQVLGGYNSFGEIWKADVEPSKWQHVFASIQTIHRRRDELLQRWPDLDWFEYVVIDEAHHGAAESYRFVVDQIKAKWLLGLTATPERMDLSDISQDFEGRFAAEMRLAEGIRKGLLSPFHYFGIGDDTPDLSSVRWNGKYVLNDLERKLVNEPYADAVISSVKKITADYRQVRAIGFCASIVQSEFMARHFSQHGLQSISLSSVSPQVDRERVKQMLTDGDIQYVFTVDLFNEGVDIPAVDTVLFLRPTESLTIFLQQLGRGLRNFPGKDVLTVVDFVGNAHQSYDFTHKFRAMLGCTSTQVRGEIENDFPSLPTDCAIVLDESSQNRILQHIEMQIPKTRSRLLDLINQYDNITLPTFLHDSGFDPEFLIYKAGLWYQIQEELANPEYFPSKMETIFKEFILNAVLQLNSISVCQRWKDAITASLHTQTLSNDGTWLCYEILRNRKGSQSPWKRPEDLWAWLFSNSKRIQELMFWLSYQEDRIEVMEEPMSDLTLPGAAVLKHFAAYTWPGIKWAFRQSDWEKSPVEQGGVNQIKDNEGKIILRYLMITVHKKENLFSSETMYQDWALNRDVFQWDSPNSWTPSKGQGKTFLQQIERGVPLYVFVRETKQDEYRRALPFIFMGPVHIVPDSAKGEYPFSLRLHLEKTMPVSEFRRLCMPVAG